jgi:hypothetical protein
MSLLYAKLIKSVYVLFARSSDTSSSFDVLGDIMKSQSNLHRNLSDVVINRDGKVKWQTEIELVMLNFC